MTTQILDGKMVSQVRREKLIPRVQAFIKRVGRAPHLVVVLIGENIASQVYVRNKVKACESIGMQSTKRVFGSDLSQSQLEELIIELNEDPKVDGVLVQLPLPSHLSEETINEKLCSSKDVDGFTYLSLGLLWGGHSSIAPCTPKGIMTILDYYGISVAGKHAVVVGRSNIVGKPMAHLLTQSNATVTVCHSKTPSLEEYTMSGDIVVVAAGKREFLGRGAFKKGAVVIDVGIHGTGGGTGHGTGANLQEKKQKIVGDVRSEELMDWVSAMTPVPGGVGPMTITTLLENTMELAEIRAHK